jgi:hypothetical protein
MTNGLCLFGSEFYKGITVLTRLTFEERERLAHAEGFTNTAELFAKIADLEHAARVLLRALDRAPDINATISNAADALWEALE